MYKYIHLMKWRSVKACQVEVNWTTLFQHLAVLSKYLNLGCKKAARCGKYGSCPKYRKWGDSLECSFGNQWNAPVAYGSNCSHSNIP